MAISGDQTYLTDGGSADKKKKKVFGTTLEK
jgi:hypothetical protein